MPLFLSVFFIGIGILTVTIPFYFYFSRRSQANNWQQTEAIVEHAELRIKTHQRQGFNTGKSFLPEITYSFSAQNGKQYRGSQYSFAASYPPQTAKKITASFSPGQKINVVYDPDQPENSVINPNYMGQVAPFIFGGIFFTAIGVLGIFLDFPAILESLGFD